MEGCPSKRLKSIWFADVGGGKVRFVSILFVKFLFQYGSKYIIVTVQSKLNENPKLKPPQKLRIPLKFNPQRPSPGKKSPHPQHKRYGPVPVTSSINSTIQCRYIFRLPRNQPAQPISLTLKALETSERAR